MQNSNAETDEHLHPLREVPRWTWAGKPGVMVPTMVSPAGYATFLDIFHCAPSDQDDRYSASTVTVASASGCPNGLEHGLVGASSHCVSCSAAIGRAT